MTTRFKRQGRHSVKGHAGVAHQNIFAFHHNKNSTISKKIDAIPNHGVCHRCYEIIEWKKKYHKYKPLKEARKCNDCGQRAVLFAYHVICQPCGSKKGVCCKCLNTGEKVALKDDEVKLEDLTREEFAGLRERERRALLRAAEKGDISVTELRKVLEGKEIERREAEGDFDDDDEFDEDDVNEEDFEEEDVEHM